MYRVNDLARVHTYTRGLKAHAANKMRFYGVESVEFQPVAPPLSVTPVELRIPLAEPNPSPAVVHRRSFSIFPSSIFFLETFATFAKVGEEEKKDFRGMEIFRDFRPRFRSSRFFSRWRSGVARSMVFRRPLISHEASPFTATGQVNRICDEAIDEASDELLLEK